MTVNHAPPPQTEKNEALESRGGFVVTVGTPARDPEDVERLVHVEIAPRDLQGIMYERHQLHHANVSGDSNRKTAYTWWNCGDAFGLVWWWWARKRLCKAGTWGKEGMGEGPHSTQCTVHSTPRLVD